MAANSPITLDSVVCPSCAVRLPKRNKGCPHCAYEFAENLHGRVGSMREMMESTAAGQFNNVSSAFLLMFAEAVRRTPEAVYVLKAA